MACELNLKDGSLRPLPVRERKIPKPGGSGKVRKLGIPTIKGRVVQESLRLVLEPLFEPAIRPPRHPEETSGLDTTPISVACPRHSIGAPCSVLSPFSIRARPWWT